jgi:hypothetical protein
MSDWGGLWSRGEWPAAARDVPAQILTSTGTGKEAVMLWTIAVPPPRDAQVARGIAGVKAVDS